VNISGVATLEHLEQLLPSDSHGAFVHLVQIRVFFGERGRWLEWMVLSTNKSKKKSFYGKPSDSPLLGGFRGLRFEACIGGFRSQWGFPFPARRPFVPSA